ncbi:MAG: AAA family ATPase [Planctomycetes bacterium]|nr:AAA family ATPase [Planctomycetota bacterium]
MLLKKEIGKFIVGQDDVVRNVLIAIVCGGHVLLEGVPGLGKTALVSTLSKALNLDFRRIQFTPDLLPADILGTNILVEEEGRKSFRFQQGPVFSNILLADEINRATPKTQSALLETMQEKTVTVANQTHILSRPYFVLATQNPLEMDGTYSLPEAQLDRFFFKLIVEMPKHDEFATILKRTTGNTRPEVSSVLGGTDILAMERCFREIPIDDSVMNDLIRLVRSTHPDDEDSSDSVKKYVRYGASPRAAQTLLAGARVQAALSGRFHVSLDDIYALAPHALRHRMVMSFEGDAEGVTADSLIKELVTS